VARNEARGDAGVEGNSRLTAQVAVILLLLLFVVGLTVPVAHSQTRWHVFLGVLVIPPVLLKVASTTWRFVKYYAGSRAYRRKGPPMLVLRLLGPIVVVLTLTLLFSGVGLVVGAPRSLRPLLSQIHHASFLLWFVVMTIHVLGHLRETASLAPRDFLRRRGRAVTGAFARPVATLLSVGIGLVCAWAILPYVTAAGYLSR